jgi:hypothetical protein
LYIYAKKLMEKAILVGLLFIGVFLSSCDLYTTNDKLMAYNRISGINDTLDKMTNEWHRLLDNAVSGKNYSALRPYRMSIGLFLNNSRATVSGLKINPVSENLIDSEEVFLATQDSIVSELYPNFDAFTDLTPDETIQAQLKLIVGDQANEAAGSAAIRRSLTAFALKNNLNKKNKQTKVKSKNKK